MTEQQRRRPRRGVETGLRTAAVWATVSDLVTQRQQELGRPLRVLDLGGGTGGLAVPLALAGHEVIVVDPSPDALAALRRRAAEAGVGETLRSAQGDADDLRTILRARVIWSPCMAPWKWSMIHWPPCAASAMSSCPADTCPW